MVRELDAECVKRGSKPETRRKFHSLIRSILRRFAVEARYLDSAPCLPPMPKAGRKVTNTLTDQDVSPILAWRRRAIGSPSYSPPMRGFGQARSEGSSGATSTSRADSSSFARACVVARRRRRSRGTSGSFRSRPSFTRRSPGFASAIATLSSPERSTARRGASGDLRQAFTRARKRAGVEPFRLHDLRHYFATALFRRGVAAPTVQALAGHAHLTTTQRYAHVARVDLRAAIERLAGESVATAWKGPVESASDVD